MYRSPTLSLTGIVDPRACSPIVSSILIRIRQSPLLVVGEAGKQPREGRIAPRGPRPSASKAARESDRSSQLAGERKALRERLPCRVGKSAQPTRMSLCRWIATDASAAAGGLRGLTHPTKRNHPIDDGSHDAHVPGDRVVDEFRDAAEGLECLPLDLLVGEGLERGQRAVRERRGLRFVGATGPR